MPVEQREERRELVNHRSMWWKMEKRGLGESITHAPAALDQDWRERELETHTEALREEKFEGEEKINPWRGVCCISGKTPGRKLSFPRDGKTNLRAPCVVCSAPQKYTKYKTRGGMLFCVCVLHAGSV